MVIPAVPENTIFEREPLDPPVPPKALLLLKVMMLEFGKLYCLAETMTPTQLIDAMENCRRQGFLHIVETDEGFQMKLTPTGAVQAFLEKLKSQKLNPEISFTRLPL